MFARFIPRRWRVTLLASPAEATSGTSVKKTFVVSPRPDTIRLGQSGLLDAKPCDAETSAAPGLTIKDSKLSQMEMNLLDEAEHFTKLYPGTVQFLQVGGFYELFDISNHNLEQLSR